MAAFVFVDRWKDKSKNKDKNRAGICGFPHRRIEMGGTHIVLIRIGYGCRGRFMVGFLGRNW